ncbi:uncharacterized protein G2W53_017526 [Senna tora]|uniref:Uncharacterized protein n=1 Tax=Senna tora TaxID=362788 RepID=A0A834TS29_9FABA|nr:uncharacterized protein G2W53_017526 [Senna tora]
MKMVVALESDQTMAFCSSIGNSLIQRRDIQCNASDKGKRIKKHRDQHLPKFGMTDSELFKDLCCRGLMCLKPGKISTTPFPAWFLVDLTCAYHWSTPGHSIESCEQFKNHVLSLLDAGRISLPGPVIKEEGGEPSTEGRKPGLRGEGQRLKDQMARVERREQELRKENHTYRLHHAEKQSHRQDLRGVNHCPLVKVDNYPSSTLSRLFNPY